jgi:hypothetical protein
MTHQIFNAMKLGRLVRNILFQLYIENGTLSKKQLFRFMVKAFIRILTYFPAYMQIECDSCAQIHSTYQILAGRIVN